MVTQTGLCCPHSAGTSHVRAAEAGGSGGGAGLTALTWAASGHRAGCTDQEHVTSFLKSTLPTHVLRNMCEGVTASKEVGTRAPGGDAV